MKTLSLLTFLLPITIFSQPDLSMEYLNMLQIMEAGYQNKNQDFAYYYMDIEVQIHYRVDGRQSWATISGSEYDIKSLIHGHQGQKVIWYSDLARFEIIPPAPGGTPDTWGNARHTIKVTGTRADVQRACWGPRDTWPYE